MNKFSKIFLILLIGGFLFFSSSPLLAVSCTCIDPVGNATTLECNPTCNDCINQNSSCSPVVGPVQTGGSTAEGSASPEVASVGSTVESVSLQNPLGITDPNQIIGNVIKAILGIVGSLALAIFIFGGFTWVISAGNEEKIKKGKDMILWATLGLVVIFFSYALVTFVLEAIGGATA